MLRKEQVELSIDVTPNLMITTCPGIIAQLLTNLISNAQRHAFGPSVNNDVNRVSVSCSRDTKGIVISVQDNGKGIPEALHKKVFEPFYTTARGKGGTGLGLNVHEVTKLTLRKFTFEKRGVEFLSAHSGAEGLALFKANPDIALAFVDVVMETDDAGLNLVDAIRNELNNHTARLILRTGQPGQAPEEEVIRRYDINDYALTIDNTSKP